MKLTPIERIKALEILPDHGTIFNLKIVRKLKESLSFSEAELKMASIKNEYQCPHREGDVGQRCGNKGFFSEAPKCGIHNIIMELTGKLNFTFSPEFANSDKEIHMGPEALSLVSNSLKAMDANGALTEAHISLYEKFFVSEEIQIPEIIRKAME